MAREKRVFSEEFKREAVKLVGQPGARKAAIARDLSIGANLLGRWCRDANVDTEVAVGHEQVASGRDRALNAVERARPCSSQLTGSANAAVQPSTIYTNAVRRLS